ncbi:MAG: M28 family peptidase [Bacteroidales bacterium]|jgi:PKD repeat protein|nr:M28 family peptidase [Bacteroidales bacterium]
MKHFISFMLISLFSFTVLAQGKFVFIPTNSFEEVQMLFNRQDLTVHHYKDLFVLGTLQGNAFIENMVIVDENSFSDNDIYTIAYCKDEQKPSYLKKMSQRGKVLYDADNFLIMKQFKGEKLLDPAKNDGMVIISNNPAYLPTTNFEFPTISQIDPNIETLLNQISIDSIMNIIQHLEDYGTRLYSTSQAVEAANWIKERYESWGLQTALENFNGYGYLGPVNSSNVIAIQQGTTKPDEYIICGGHYDSINWYDGDAAPGSDDNSTGTAGVMEIARIFSQYEFERSIIYCAFGAEEVGLCGSDAYAVKCKSDNMNILGYFNIDMSGYIAPGLETLISIIRPSSATPLANYYINVLETYYKDTQYEQISQLSGGDSDHTSFNNQGYMGIYPFENENHYSPYIHTSNDYIGLSLNSPDQVLLYTQITAACIAELGLLGAEEVAPIADFSAEETEITAGDSIYFMDLSEYEPTSWSWFFEGGEPETSDQQNPSITFLVPGIYDVKLVVENNAGKDSVIKENYITVNRKILPPVAAFEADRLNIEEGESISFKDISENEPDTWAWYFEGGEPNASDQQHPTVVYNVQGTFNVKLTVSNEAGVDEAEATVVVLPFSGIDEQQISFVKIAPNPVKSNSYMKVESDIVIRSIDILNLSGQLIQSYEINAQSTEFLIPALSSGLYLLNINDQSAHHAIKIQVY